MPHKVCFLCPVAESVNPTVFQHTLALISYSSHHGVEFKFIGVTERTLIHAARNQLAMSFKATDCDWAFWMDADMKVPADTIIRLLKTAEEREAKFVTGVYYQRLGEHHPVLWRKNPELLDGTTIKPEDYVKPDAREAYLHFPIVPTGTVPVKADVCGFGCVLTHREMFEKIPPPYFKTISDDCSEDFYFCLQAKAAGYQLWADPSLKLGHMSAPKFIDKDDFRMDPAAFREVKA